MLLYDFLGRFGPILSLGVNGLSQMSQHSERMSQQRTSNQEGGHTTIDGVTITTQCRDNKLRTYRGSI